MHVHAQAMVTIREQERREWLAIDDRHRQVATTTGGEALALADRRARIGQMVRELTVMFRSLRSICWQKLT